MKEEERFHLAVRAGLRLLPASVEAIFNPETRVIGHFFASRQSPNGCRVRLCPGGQEERTGLLRVRSSESCFVPWPRDGSEQARTVGTERVEASGTGPNGQRASDKACSGRTVRACAASRSVVRETEQCACGEVARVDPSLSTPRPTSAAAIAPGAPAPISELRLEISEARKPPHKAQVRPFQNSNHAAGLLPGGRKSRSH